MKRQAVDLEKIFAKHPSIKWLVSRIYEEFLWSHSKQTQWKIWQKIWTNLSYRRYTDDKYSTSLVIKGMQIKTTMISYYMPFRIAKTKKTGNTKCWWGMWNHWNSHTVKRPAKYHSIFRRQYGSVLCLYIYLSSDSAIQIPGIKVIN